MFFERLWFAKWSLGGQTWASKWPENWHQKNSQQASVFQRSKLRVIKSLKTCEIIILLRFTWDLKECNSRDNYCKFLFHWQVRFFDLCTSKKLWNVGGSRLKCKISLCWEAKYEFSFFWKMRPKSSQQASVDSKGRKLRVIKSLKHVGNYSTCEIYMRFQRVQLERYLL